MEGLSPVNSLERLFIEFCIFCIFREYPREWEYDEPYSIH